MTIFASTLHVSYSTLKITSVALLTPEEKPAVVKKLLSSCRWCCFPCSQRRLVHVASPTQLLHLFAQNQGSAVPVSIRSTNRREILPPGTNTYKSHPKATKLICRYLPHISFLIFFFPQIHEKLLTLKLQAQIILQQGRNSNGIRKW